MTTWNEQMGSVSSKDRDEASNMLVPKGAYNVQCSEAGIKETNSGKKFFQFKFTIKGPTHAGRVVFQTYWIQSQNAEYVKRCFAQIQTFALKAGIPEERVQSMQPSEFVGLVAGASVKIEKGEGSYQDSNAISHYTQVINEMPSPANTNTHTQSNDIPF